MPDIEKTVTNAILKINPSAEVTVKNIFDIDNCEIKWLNGTTPISKEDIKKEYPSIEELVVALYDSEDKADVDSKRAEIKAKYPK